MRQAAELLLRRAREGQRRHTGHLGGHDVHQHAGDQGREAAGDVETHTADGHLAVHDARARAEVGARARSNFRALRIHGIECDIYKFDARECAQYVSILVGAPPRLVAKSEGRMIKRAKRACSAAPKTP